jgi:hypothetical protein
MTDEMTRKLRDVFDTLFGIAKPESERGESSVPLKKTIKYIELSADKTSIRINEKSKVNVKLRKSDGTPVVGVVTDFTIKDTRVLGFIGGSNPKTGNDGNATVEIQGKDKGETTIIVKATVEGKLEQDEIIISVTA